MADHVPAESGQRPHPVESLDGPVFADVPDAELGEPWNQFLGNGLCYHDESDRGGIAVHPGTRRGDPPPHVLKIGLKPFQVHHRDTEYLEKRFKGIPGAIT